MKITKYLTLLAAAVGMTAACQQEEMVVFNPDNVIAPVLHAVEDIVVTVSLRMLLSLGMLPISE